MKNDQNQACIIWTSTPPQNSAESFDSQKPGRGGIFPNVSLKVIYLALDLIDIGLHEQSPSLSVYVCCVVVL